MPRIKGTSLFYHFGHDLGPWYIGLRLVSDPTWEQAKQPIKLRRLELLMSLESCCRRDNGLSQRQPYLSRASVLVQAVS